MMIIAAIRSTHSKRRTFQIMPRRNAPSQNSRIAIRNSRGFSLASTYVSWKDLKNLAGLVGAVEGWRRCRPSSLVNAFGCNQKTSRWRTRANPPISVRSNEAEFKFQSAIYLRSRLNVAGGTTLAYFDIFRFAKTRSLPFLIEDSF